MSAVLVVARSYEAFARGDMGAPFVHLWTFHGELAVRFRQFLDIAGCVEALAP